MPSITLAAPAGRTACAPSTPRVSARLDPRVAEDIGPRYPGAVYQNIDGRFEVLTTITDPAEASKILHRRACFVLIVRDTLRPDGIPFFVGSVWTSSDWLVRSADHSAL